ncbi:MAG: HEAT repeat domain-containing protein [Gammaproteobacteria bacterium]|nr:MAG: HEAT repeat domain-containing protein [Gammaproteobacteria bacterium]
MNKSLSLTLTAILTALFLQSCAPSAYKVNSPTPSKYAYTKTSDTAKLELSFHDGRGEKDKVFSEGTLKAGLLLDKKPIEPISYIKENTAKELQARGLNTTVVEKAPVDITINKLFIRNYRSNGFSPFITFTMLSADVITPSGKQRVGVYIKRGKVPVWSFDEVIEPTFNEPLSLVVKELSAKINGITSKQSISDDQVTKLAAEINANPAAADSYLKVYQLGFGFNKTAVKHLVTMSKSADEYVRLAAISSLGNLKADGELSYLKELYNSSTGSWQDRGMALKAICDIGTAEAMTFAKQAKADLDKPSKRDKDDITWTKEILALYL